MWQDRSVLVVEDDEAVQQLLAREVGRELGAYTVVAQDGAEALRWARRLRPSVVILDLTLPTIDGFEVARRLRADDTTRSVGIIAVSAMTPATATREKAIEAGCDEFVPKPFDLQELIDAVHRRLGQSDQPEA